VDQCGCYAVIYYYSIYWNK